MIDIERLKPLHQLARNDTDRAARELGQALLRQETLNRQMIELVRYRDSYRQELHQAMADSLRGDQAQCGEQTNVGVGRTEAVEAAEQ